MTERHQPPHPYRGIISDDPDVLLMLPYIPYWLRRFIPKDRRGAPSDAQKRQIRRILMMRRDKSFNRCRGQSKKKVLAFEQQGDYTHSGWIYGTHGYQPATNNRRKRKPQCDFCEKCRCNNVAGYGTKGDFYGLGPETGTYGVGFCTFCNESHLIRPKIVLLHARREVEYMQKYGEASMDSEYALKEIKAETDLAKRRNDMRQEMDVAYHALQELTQELVTKKRPQQRVFAGKESGYVLEEVDDVTLLDMREKAVRMLDKLRLSDLKLDRTKFLQVDHVMQASKEIELAVRDAIDQVRELSVKQTLGEDIETDRPVTEFVWDVFAERWAKIWLDLRTKCGQGVRQP